MKGCISFSLWGNNPDYHIGLFKNIELARKIYPGWDIAVHVPQGSASIYQFGTTEDSKHIHLKYYNSGMYGLKYKNLFARMSECSNTNYTHVIVRDTDSRLNEREADAVNDWVMADVPFHIMRDHPKHHNAKIMGGMFGAMPRYVGMMFEPETMVEWLKEQPDRETPLGTNWGIDQKYLREMVWPVIKMHHLAHDDCKRKTRSERKFKVKLPKGMFVGQRFNANNEPEVV